MQKPSRLDSKEWMDYLLAKHGSGWINAQMIEEMNRGIEEDMKDFDRLERIRNAKAAEELSKIIITA